MIKWQGGFKNNLSKAQFDLESHVLFHVMNKDFEQFTESLHKQDKGKLSRGSSMNYCMLPSEIKFNWE